MITTRVTRFLRLTDIVKQNYSVSANVRAAVDNAQVKQQQNNAAELDKLYKQVSVEIRGHEPAVIESYTTFVKQTATQLDLSPNLTIKTPYRFIERWSILKSKFVKKKHFRQYEMRTHFKIFEFKYLTGSTSDTLLEYIQRNLPEGIAMHVSKTELQSLPEHIKPPNN